MSEEASYRDSHATPGKGEQYDSYYESDPWQAFMWRQEQACIDDLLSEHLSGRDVSLLDFACGSGRITSFLETRVARCVGVDVSEPMLERARAKLNRTELITADLTRENPLEGRRFDLITAFRFFTNAEDELRRSVMQVLPNYLADDGYVLFNNHHIPDSMFYRTQDWIARLRGRSRASTVRMMSMKETLALIEEAGLRPIAMRHVGFLHLPRLRLPMGLVESAENLAQRSDWMSRHCESVMVLCSR
jgi:SAM-dependent methyltransferase